jgi:uncharacterized membrane protein (UPF0127 family)
MGNTAHEWARSVSHTTQPLLSFSAVTTFACQTPTATLLEKAERCLALFTGVMLLAMPAHPREADGTPQMNLPRTQLRAGMFNIDAQVANTQPTRATGLMWRRNMPAHEGMLFVFEQAAVQCFWMRNTPSPLTAAFLADDGTIVNLADMVPFSEDSHCSAKPVRFVLEMNQGWFAQRGIKAGAKLEGDPFVRK